MKTALWIISIPLFISGLFIYLVTSVWNTWAISLCIAGLVLFGIWLVVDRHGIKKELKRKKIFYGVNLVVLIIVVLGLVVTANYVSSDYYERWDLTANRQFTLSNETNKVLNRLQHKLKITAFFQEGTSAKINDLLADYSYLNKNIQYEVIDPDKEPTIAKNYGINTNGVIVLQYKNKTIKIEQANENGITNAVIKLLRNRVINICYLTGNGERDLSDTTKGIGYGKFKQALRDQDYKVRKLLLPSAASIPTTCTMVIGAGAIKPFLPSELKVLTDYLKRGGYLFLMIDSETQTGISGFLSKYGIDVGNNVVLDKVVRLFQGPGLGIAPIVKTYSKKSDITQNFEGETIFPLVRTVDAAKSKNPDYNIVSIAKTSNTSWADTDLKTLFSKGIARFEPNDIRGPVSVAAAGTLKFGNKIARIAVFGTARIASNKYINALFNKDLVMNTVSWLVKEENLITIRPKTNKNQQMFLTAAQGKLIFYLTVILIPLLLFFGAMLAYKRMRRL